MFVSIKGIFIFKICLINVLFVEFLVELKLKVLLYCIFSV